jgi:hypothetical protein
VNFADRIAADLAQLRAINALLEDRAIAATRGVDVADARTVAPIFSLTETKLKHVEVLAELLARKVNDA